MKKALSFISYCCLGAGAMYMMDPARGRSRRAFVRSKAFHYVKKSQHMMMNRLRDMNHRMYGSVAEMRSRMKNRIQHAPVEDHILIERVRSKIGRVASHLRQIQILAYHGSITLAGPCLSDEMDALISTVSRVPGVKRVENRLTPQENMYTLPQMKQAS